MNKFRYPIVFLMQFCMLLMFMTWPSSGPAGAWAILSAAVAAGFGTFVIYALFLKD